MLAFINLCKLFRKDKLTKIALLIYPVSQNSIANKTCSGQFFFDPMRKNTREMKR